MNSFTNVLTSVVPDVNPEAPPGMEGLTTVIGWVGWGVLILCVIGVLITAGMMAVANRRGEGGEHAGRLGFVLVATVLVGAAGGLVGALA